MRARLYSIIGLLVLAVLSPLLAPASAEQPQLYDAGAVQELPGLSVAWFELPNGDMLYVNASGTVSAWNTPDDAPWTMVWDHPTNVTVNGVDFNDDGDLLALAHDAGVVVFSVDYQDTLYTIASGQSVDDVTWDRDGDLWGTQRVSKWAVEWTDGSATGFQTSAHLNTITGVEALSDGSIVTVARDKKVRVHDEFGSSIRTLSESSAYLVGVSLSPDESRMYSWTDNCRLVMHNVSDWASLGTLNVCPSGMIKTVTLVGDRLMVGTVNGKAYSIDASSHGAPSNDDFFGIPGEISGFRATSGSGILVLAGFSSASEVVLLDTDSDGDGTPDGADAFPEDPTQDSDRDGDGYGDDAQGTDPDAFPDDSSQWADRDGDNRGDNPAGTNPDLFPDNRDQQDDSDGDGWGDNTNGQDGDKFPDDPTQWADSDRDGYGDSDAPGATTPDACPNQNGNSHLDRLGCQDRDGDGWSDPGNGEEAHPVGNADAFPGDESQWRDTDGDGYGDNLTGTRGDACPSIHGNSTRAVFYDAAENRYTSIYRYGCLDSDGDGYDDSTESAYGQCSLVGNRSEWIDHDRDCVGSNSDYNDTDPGVATLADHCEKHPNASACGSFNTGDPGPVVNPGPTEQTQEEKMMAAAKDFAIYGGIILVVMIAAIGVLVGAGRMVGTVSANRKPDAQYTHQDATQELDAWESGDKFQTRGGLSDNKHWDDEPVGDDAEVEMDDLFAMAADLEEDIPAPPSAEELYADDAEGDDEDIPAPPSATPAPAPAAAPVEAPVPAPAETPAAPAEAPPIPAAGLPEGWTEEQWRWYGHQWLEKHGQ